jgi:hypothetical protein
MTNLRELMPITATQIDLMRERMGVAAANEVIRKAMRGEAGVFFAMENHRTFGTQDTRTTSSIAWDAQGKAYRIDSQWMTDAIEFALTLGIEIERHDMQDHEEARVVAERLRQILRERRYA